MPTPNPSPDTLADTGPAGRRRRIIRPLADLRAAPDGPRDRQLLFGETVTVQRESDGWAFVRACRDGYEGWLRSDLLGPERAATHQVVARATHLYDAPDMKSPERAALSFGSRVTVMAEHDGFLETPEGFVPRPHLQALDRPLTDPVEAAARLLGTPYLWGGNSCWGIDCSGLVQAALLACARPCPGDSHQQQAALGTSLPEGTEPIRGDLLFWKGHVAIVAGPELLLHANAFHMAVTYEPMRSALARIARQGDGPILAHKRL